MRSRPRTTRSGVSTQIRPAPSVDSPTVAEAVSERVTAMRNLVAEYAAQHDLAEPDTGLVDAGWTGRMIGSLVSVCEARGMSRPNVLLWGHEPRATGWTDPGRVAAYMYDTSRGEGLDLRVPDAPFIVATFCMGDHGIVSGYRKTPAGRIEPILSAETNTAAAAWGLEVYRSVLCAFCDALDGGLDGDVTVVAYIRYRAREIAGQLPGVRSGNPRRGPPGAPFPAANPASRHHGRHRPCLKQGQPCPSS